MTDSVPPPLPMAKQSCCGRFPAFLTGLIVGAAVVGVAATVFIRREHARAEMAMADAQAALLHVGAGVPQASGMLNNLFGGEPSKVNDAPAQTEASRIKSLGDEAVDDLRQGRLLAVYRLTTKEYQAGMKQEDFDKMIAGVQHLSSIYANPQQRESKVRKASDGDGYEYYCSSPPAANAGNVVFSFIFVPGEHGAWRISDVQVTYVNR